MGLTQRKRSSVGPSQGNSSKRRNKSGSTQDGVSHDGGDKHKNGSTTSTSHQVQLEEPSMTPPSIPSSNDVYTDGLQLPHALMQLPSRDRHNSVMSSATVLNDGVAYSKKVREMDVRNVQGDITAALEDVQLPPLFDAACDPDNPRTVKFQDISAAAYKLRGGVVRTPCAYSSKLSDALGVELYFKKEFLQVTGSFKERGARYAMMRLTEEQRKNGITAASAGNHALALSYHGKQLNIPVTVVMPVISPLMKITLCRLYGATVLIEGATLMESKTVSLKLAATEGMTYINGYDHVDILAGQGTIGLEILDEVKNVDAVLVPTGGGGLIAGIAVAIKYLQPNVKIIAVEAENCASFKYALDMGRPERCENRSSLADGLSVATVGVNSFASCAKLIDECVSVSECDIALAILRLVENEKAVVEGAGAIGLAALLAGKLPHLKGKRVVTVLCGGNIDSTILGRCIERGLAVDGRLARFEVTVSDRPGGIAELATLLAQSGASIKDMFHERAWLRTDIFSVRVKVVVETRDAEHLAELQRTISEHYDAYFFYATKADEKSPPR